MKKTGCFLAFLFLLAGVPAHAADVTIYGGVQQPGNITLSAAAEGTTNFLTDPKSFGTFGLRFGGGRVVGTETTIGYNPNFIDTNSKALIFGQNVLIQAPLPVVKPYGTIGVGYVFVSGEGPSDIGSKFALNYGGGLKVRIAGPFGVRLDARGYTLPSVQDQTLNFMEVSFGLVFGF